MRIFYHLFIGFILFNLWACSDDFEINSDWQDKTIVMGLLDATDSVQYIRINRAFLGDGEVYQMAQVSDSIQYRNALHVMLIEYQIEDVSVDPFNAFNWRRTSRDTIYLTRTSEIPKEPGTFASSPNYLYKTAEQINSKYKYKLLIQNQETGKQIWAETYMIYDMIISNPNRFATNKINMENEGFPYATRWEGAVYGKVYECALRLNYFEIENGDTLNKSIVLNYTPQISSIMRSPMPGESGQEMEQSMGGSKFYKNIAEKIEPKTNTLRVFRTLDFIYYIGGQNFATYLNVSEAKVSYGQMAPTYSNVYNGEGLFDSRYKYEVNGKELTVSAVDSLANGRFTKDLGFANYTRP